VLGFFIQRAEEQREEAVPVRPRFVFGALSEVAVLLHALKERKRKKERNASGAQSKRARTHAKKKASNCIRRRRECHMKEKISTPLFSTNGLLEA
jgi:hypothetical protein